MFLVREGMQVHLFTSDPAADLASPGEYVGTVVSDPSEAVTTDELLKRLGVQMTVFEYDFADDAGALGTFEISGTIPAGARVIGGEYKVETTFTSA